MLDFPVDLPPITPLKGKGFIKKKKSWRRGSVFSILEAELRSRSRPASGVWTEPKPGDGDG